MTRINYKTAGYGLGRNLILSLLQYPVFLLLIRVIVVTSEDRTSR